MNIKQLHLSNVKDIITKNILDDITKPEVKRGKKQDNYWIVDTSAGFSTPNSDMEVTMHNINNLFLLANNQMFTHIMFIDR